MVLIASYVSETNVQAGLTLSLAFWLFIMLVYSPIIGWGTFGVGGSSTARSPSDPLYLGSSLKYVVATSVLHLIYGSIIGGLNPRWIDLRERSRTSE
jgi:hypothetical protein